MILNPKAWWTYLRSSGDNFHTVIAGRIYRSATPSPKNLQHWYYKYGIRTWIDLRQVEDWDGDARVASDKHKNFQEQVAKCDELGIERIWIPISDRTPTSDADIDRVIAELRNRSKDGILVACAGGRHRAGAMIALFGQRVLGWTRDRIKASLKQGGFYPDGHRDFARRLEQLLGFALALLLLVVPVAGQTSHPFIRPDLASQASAPAVVRAADLAPSSPPADEKFNRTFGLVSGLWFGASAADLVTTKFALDRGGIERNFLHAEDNGHKLRWTSAIAATVGTWGFAAYCEKKGHPRIARAVLVIGAVVRTGLAFWNNSRSRR